MRTNIVVDDNLMAEALKLNDIKTKKGVVEEALKLLVQVKRQEAIRARNGVRLEWHLLKLLHPDKSRPSD